MNTFKNAALLTGLLSAACTRYQTVLTPQGVVEERISYPQYEAIRTKKQVKLSLADQEQIKLYYRTYHSWPLTIEGFMAESNTNYQLVRNLNRQGFADLNVVGCSADTLRIDFVFQTSGNLVLDENFALHGLGRELTGSFIFIANPLSDISFQQIVGRKNK